MNKQRRKAIGDIYDKLIDIQSDLEYIRDEEQEAFDLLLFISDVLKVRLDI